MQHSRNEIAKRSRKTNHGNAVGISLPFDLYEMQLFHLVAEHKSLPERDKPPEVYFPGLNPSHGTGEQPQHIRPRRFSTLN